jgi:hypothetical protein
MSEKLLPIVLFCKSYSKDLYRTLRLARSIDQFNTENLPFYISVPSEDMALFTEHLLDTSARIICDDSIILSNPKHDLQKIKALHGGTSQQIIKSEFWRLGISDNYLCIDSDSMFIGEFGAANFMADSETPYTVIDEGKELLNEALENNKKNFIQNFFNESENFKALFSRAGKRYSFGPNPVIWNTKVWQSLEERYLAPNHLSFYEATLKNPIDLNWYGEALLKYKVIPLMPSQPLFKVFAFAWQYDKYVKKKISNKDLSEIYLGVIYQSAWERNMDWPSESGTLASRLARRVRRFLGRM